MTQDELEARSRRYGPAGLTVVPLTSGKLAVFVQDRSELLAITVETVGWDELNRWAREAEARYGARRIAETQPRQTITRSLEDLGL